MSLEERVVALEKGFAALQQDFLLYRTDTTSSSILIILNKVIAAQELRYREISENQTMLRSMFSSMQKDVKTLQEDVSDIKDSLVGVEQRLDRVEQRLGRLDSMEQRLGRLETKFDEHTALLTQILERLPGKS